MKFKTNKLVWVITILSLLLSVYFIYDHHLYKKDRLEKSITEGQITVNEIDQEINELINEIIVNGEALKSELIERKDSLERKDLYELVQKYSHKAYHLLGTSISFRPYGFDSTTRLLAPYYDKRKDRVVNLQHSYDYTVEGDHQNTWFTEPFKKNGPNWTEPYSGKVARIMVADYGIPFDLNDDDIPEGVISFTIDLKKLASKVDSLVVGRTGTGIITSKEGKLIASPYPDYILDIDMDSIAVELNMRHQMDEIMEKEKGYVSFTRITGQQAFAFYSTIPIADWKIVITFNASDLLGNADQLHRKLVKICMSFSLFLFLLIWGIIGFDSFDVKRLWLISCSFSLFIVVNIVLMWYLNMNFNYAKQTDSEVRVESRADLESFIKKENHKLSKLGLKRFVPIPTGVFIEGFQFLDSYTISVRGEIWEKWPAHLTRYYEPGFRFPQEAEVGLTKIFKKSEEEIGDYMVHTWTFKLNLKMPLDYSKYPFDVRDLNIEVMYPDAESGVLLVPDVDGYTNLSPYSVPAINKNIYFKDSKLIASRFSFDIVDFNARFGHKKFDGINRFPIMKLTLHLKRRLLNVMVTNIIPIMVVASMIFLIFYSNTKKKDDKSGVSMMGVIQSCAGFFFVLIVAHIDLRRTLVTPELTYIETFYLTMYVILALLAINVVAFNKSDRYKFFNYQDNLLVKVSYWPLLLFSWMVITLFVFYF